MGVTTNRTGERCQCPRSRGCTALCLLLSLCSSQTGTAAVAMGSWAHGECVHGQEVQNPGQGHSGDGGDGLDWRQLGLDAGGSGRDVGGKQQSGGQGHREAGQVWG